MKRVRNVAMLVLLVGCARPQAAPVDEQALVLTGATVFAGPDVVPLRDAAVVVRNGTIAWVGPAAQLDAPRSAKVVDLRGMYITPGFIDTHYHLTISSMRYSRTAAGALDSIYDRALAERLLRVALARGITSLRDPGGSPRMSGVTLRDAVAAGRLAGPRIKVAGDILANPRMTAAEIREAVRAQAADRVDYIKVYSGFSPEQVAAAVDEAHKHGVGVIGHLQRTSWTEAARAGIDFITHGGNWHSAYLPAHRREAYDAMGGGMKARITWLEWLDVEGAALDSMLDVMVARNVMVDPTLVAYHTKFWWRDSIYQKHPDANIVPEVRSNWEVLGMHTANWTTAEFDRVQAAWPKQLQLVKRMHDAGVILLAGSDLASPWVIPGTAFHQELELLVSAGLSTADVLRIATRNGARALGILAVTGTIESGKRADLVVLRSDPSADIRATREIAHVMKDGHMIRPDTLLASSPD